MGDEVLEREFKDREEFSRYFHRLKAEIDRESQLIYAFYKGVEEGIKEGKEQVIKQGIKQDVEQGKEEVIEQDKAEMVRKLLADDISPKTIAMITRLSIEQVRSMMS